MSVKEVPWMRTQRTRMFTDQSTKTHPPVGRNLHRLPDVMGNKENIWALGYVVKLHWRKYGIITLIFDSWSSNGVMVVLYYITTYFPLTTDPVYFHNQHFKGLWLWKTPRKWTVHHKFLPLITQRINTKHVLKDVNYNFSLSTIEIVNLIKINDEIHIYEQKWLCYNNQT